MNYSQEDQNLVDYALRSLEFFNLEDVLVKVLAVFICAIGLMLPFGRADAAMTPQDGNQHHALHVSQEANWQRRDTATYVVSTLNLLRTNSGQPITKVAQNRLDVSRYSVWSDRVVPGLYFIQLKRDTGSVVGVLAYQMGWVKPLSVTSRLDALGVKPAPRKVQREYQAGHLVFLGAFTSSLPRYN